jgi:hypothetical protein
MTLGQLHERIAQFLETYGGKAPAMNTGGSLDVISDFLLVIDAELDFTIRRTETVAADGELTAQKQES